MHNYKLTDSDFVRKYVFRFLPQSLTSDQVYLTKEMQVVYKECLAALLSYK